MAPPILTLKNIHLSFGSTPLIEGAEFTVEPSARLCLVGRNGSGKSTLLKIAAGIIEPDEGERFLKPGTTVRYMHQEPDLSAFKTLSEYIAGGLEGADDGYRLHYLMDALGLDGNANLKIFQAERHAAPPSLALSHQNLTFLCSMSQPII